MSRAKTSNKGPEAAHVRLDRLRRVVAESELSADSLKEGRSRGCVLHAITVEGYEEITKRRFKSQVEPSERYTTSGAPSFTISDDDQLESPGCSGCSDGVLLRRKCCFGSRAPSEPSEPSEVASSCLHWFLASLSGNQYLPLWRKSPVPLRSTALNMTSLVGFRRPERNKVKSKDGLPNFLDSIDKAQIPELKPLTSNRNPSNPNPEPIT
jgi:hypothetical protein